MCELPHIVVYLLDHGIPVDTPGYCYYETGGSFRIPMSVLIGPHGTKYGTALHAAVLRGLTDLIRILLERGAAVNAKCGKFGTVLQAAAWRGRPDIIELLLVNGAQVNASSGKYGYALAAAAYMGHIRCAEILLNAGARVNAEGGCLGNALQAAIAGGFADMVDFLLKFGARVQSPDPRFEEVLSGVKEYAGGEERAAILQKFHRDHWYFNLSDPPRSVMQNPENGCWDVMSPEQDLDPWAEWLIN
jgi:hypothetical protein